MTQQTSSALEQDRAKTRTQEGYVLGLLFVVAAAAYLSTLTFGFVFDDKKQIYFNPFIKTWRYLPQYFVTSLWRRADPQALAHYYRPLYLVWLRINFALFGIRALGWHLSEILLHLFVTWLVYRAVKLMTGQATVAWLTALIFGVHPMHHEVVAWISGANESLYAALFLAAVVAYLHYRSNSRPYWLILSCLFYGLALLAKESAIVLPLLLIVNDWIAGDSTVQSDEGNESARLQGSFMRASGFLTIALVYLIVRYKVMGGFSGVAPSLSFTTCLLTLPSVLYFYLKNWMLPFHLAEFYDLPYQTSPNFFHVLLPLAILLLASAAVWKFRYRIGLRNAGYAAAWIFIPLLPALSIFLFKMDDVVHDRYFYVPSIGAAMLVALLIEQVAMGGKQRLVLGQPLRVLILGFGLAIGLALLTMQETYFWQDDYTLFTRALQIAPHNPGAINNLSVEWMSRGEVLPAEQALEQGFRENPKDSRFAANLARGFYQQKQYPTADDYARRAIALDPDAAPAYLTLAEIQLKRNDPTAAQASMRRAVELNPFEAPYHTIYGIVLEVNGNCPRALDEFKVAQSLVPGDFFNEREMAKCSAPIAPAAPARALVPKSPAR